jgi:hypothetical protein
MAGALSHAFHSDQTPAFGQMVSSMFSQSNSEQKAGMLNHLLSSVGPGALAQIPGGSMLSGMLSGGSNQVTPQQAQNISPEAVQRLASRAEQTDPSIIEKTSSFYAQHPTLIKTLGAGVMSIAMAKLARRDAA